jgi:hypothetical protein
MLNGFCRVDVDVTDACARNRSLVLHSIACHFTDWMTPVHVLLFKDLQHWLPVGVTWTAKNTWDIIHTLSIVGQKSPEKCPNSFFALNKWYSFRIRKIFFNSAQHYTVSNKVTCHWKGLFEFSLLYKGGQEFSPWDKGVHWQKEFDSHWWDGI